MTMDTKEYSLELINMLMKQEYFYMIKSQQQILLLQAIINNGQ